jgi:hypothetical protein
MMARFRPVRDVIENGLAWAVVAGVVLAILLGKRRGQESRAAAIASAKSDARAELAAELTSMASASQNVNVAVDASHRGLPGGSAAEHSCDDPWSCVVCLPVLRRVALSSVGNVTTDDRGVNDDDDDRGHDIEHARARTVPVGLARTATVRGRVVDRRHGADRVRSDATGPNDMSDDGETDPFGSLRPLGELLGGYYDENGKGRSRAIEVES